MYVPDRGDIVWLDFEPSAGKEITKRRPAFVVSRKLFNDRTGFAIFAPITSTVRGSNLEVILKGGAVEGAVLTYQLKSLDYETRNVELIEQAEPKITNKVADLAQVIVR